VCKHEAASQEPKKQHRLRVLPSRETVSVLLGGNRLMRAEGSALSLQREDASRRLAALFGGIKARRAETVSAPLDRSRVVWKSKAEILAHRIAALIDGMSAVSTDHVPARATAITWPPA
jgi:predicted nucleic acid-binding Zn ribbon protein